MIEPFDIVKTKLAAEYGDQYLKYIKFSEVGYCSLDCKEQLAQIIVVAQELLILPLKKYKDDRFLSVYNITDVEVLENIDLNYISEKNVLIIKINKNIELIFELLTSEQCRQLECIFEECNGQKVYEIKRTNNAFLNESLSFDFTHDPNSSSFLDAKAFNLSIKCLESEVEKLKEVIKDPFSNNTNLKKNYNEELERIKYQQKKVKKHNWNSELLWLEQELEKALIECEKDDNSLENQPKSGCENDLESEVTRLLEKHINSMLKTKKEQLIEDYGSQQSSENEATEIICNICKLYNEFHEQCQEIIVSYVESLIMSEEERIYSNNQFSFATSEEMIEYFEANLKNIDTGEFMPFSDEYIPEFRFLQNNIELILLVDPIAESYPNIDRNDYHLSKNDLSYIFDGTNALNVSRLLEESFDDAIVHTALTCVVEYRGFSVYCEAVDSRVVSVVQEVEQQPTKKKLFSKRQQIEPTVNQYSINEEEVVYGYEQSNGTATIKDELPQDKMQIVNNTKQYLNISSNYKLESPGSHVNNEALEIEKVRIAEFYNYLLQLFSKSPQLLKQITEERNQFEYYFQGLIGKKDIIVQETKFSFEQYEFPTNVHITLDQNERLVMHDLSLLMPLDIPCEFCEEVLLKVQNNRKHYEEVVTDMKLYKLPLKYIQLIEQSLDISFSFDDSPLVEELEEQSREIMNSLSQKDNSNVELNNTMLEELILEQFAVFNEKYNLSQINYYSDLYRTRYLPLLESIIDRHITHNDIEIEKLYEVYDFFHVPEYLEQYTASFSVFDESQEIIKEELIVKSFILLFNRALRSFYRKIQEHGLEIQDETYISQQLQILENGRQINADEFEYYTEHGNADYKQELVTRIINCELVECLNALLGNRPNRRFFLLLDSIYKKYYIQHSFGEYYAKNLGNKKFSPIIEEGCLSSYEIRRSCLDYFECMTGYVFLDKNFDFCSECPFCEGDIIIEQPIVQTSVCHYLNVMNVPFVGNYEKVNDIERELMQEFSLRVTNRCTESQTSRNEIYYVKSLLFNMHFNHRLVNAEYQLLYVNLAHYCRDRSFVNLGLIFQKRNSTVYLEYLRRLSLIQRTDGGNDSLGALSIYEIADQVSELLLSFFEKGSIKYIQFIYAEAQRCKISCRKVDNAFEELCSGLLSDCDLLAEMYAYEAFLLYQCGDYSAAQMYFTRATESLGAYVSQLSVMEAETQRERENFTGEREDSESAHTSEKEVQFRAGSTLFDYGSTQYRFWNRVSGDGVIINPLSEFLQGSSVAAALFPEEAQCAKRLAGEVLGIRAGAMSQCADESKLRLSVFLIDLYMARQRQGQHDIGLVERALRLREFLGRDSPLVLELLHLHGQCLFEQRQYARAAQDFNLALLGQPLRYALYAYRFDKEEAFRMLVRSCFELEKQRGNTAALGAERLDMPIDGDFRARVLGRILAGEDHIQEILTMIERCENTTSKTEIMELASLYQWQK